MKACCDPNELVAQEVLLIDEAASSRSPLSRRGFEPSSAHSEFPFQPVSNCHSSKLSAIATFLIRLREGLHSFFALAFFVVVFLLAESAPLIALTARLIGSGLKKLYRFVHRTLPAPKLAKPFSPVPGQRVLPENISGFRRIWTQPEVGATFRSRRLMRSSHEHVK
jgi:hypothetical protein